MLICIFQLLIFVLFFSVSKHFRCHSLQIRLIHVNSTQALKFSGRQLPDWGFRQHEVVTDKILEQEDTIWNVEEHRYTRSKKQLKFSLFLVKYTIQNVLR